MPTPLPPRPKSRVQPSHGAHAVQFYEAEAFLLDVVSNFLVDGLKNGEPVVVIATEPHRLGFAASVKAKGFDPELITFLDARGLMSEYISGGAIDEQRFLTLAGGVLDPLAARGRIRAYGEMVDLLCLEGHHATAIRLEELWNELGSLYPLTLLCTYSIGNFKNETDARTFAHVCREHGRVFPAESYRPGADENARLRSIAALQQRAAALEAEIANRRELERELREANRTKDQFLATLSHELRTPLTAILGWARMLAMGTLDEETTRTAVELIEQSAKTQAALVDDLLDISRVVAGKLALRSEPVDLGNAVANAVATLQLAAEARGVRIDVDLSAPPCIVNGDATRLQQIGWNLLSNAVKFSYAGSAVSIRIERDATDARIIVRDEGAGITRDFLPHVFEPFRQAHSPSKRSHGGLGLGLAIAKYLVELHGGSIAAASDGEGQGATFTATLPLALRQP